MKLLIILTILLLPSELLSIEPLYIPTYPTEILNANGVIYLQWEGGGEIVKYEKGVIKRSSKEVRKR